MFETLLEHDIQNRDAVELAPVRWIDAEVDDTIDLVNQMVRQAQSGDGDAFEGVYRAHVGRIHALCLRMSGDAQHAESLTQDVFVRAWEKLSSFRGDSQFSTWLHRLAINVVLQDRRSRGRRRRTSRRSALGGVRGVLGAVGGSDPAALGVGWIAGRRRADP